MTQEVWSHSDLERLVAWVRDFREGNIGKGVGKENAPFYMIKYFGVTRVLQLIAAEASARKDERWLPLLLEFAGEMIHSHPDSLQDTCNAAVRTLLANGASVTKSIRKMATSRDDSVRQAVAEGLRAEDPKALPLLRILADDNHSDVRAPAKKKLSEVEQVAYWAGLFDSDPLARLSKVDRERAGAAINTIVSFVNASHKDREELQSGFEEAVDALPDDLAGEFARRFVPTIHHWEYGKLLQTFVRRATAPSVFWDIFQSLEVGPNDAPTEMYSFSLGLQDTLASAPAALVRAMLLDWTKRLVGQETFKGDYGTTESMALQLLSRLWRDEMDAEPLVDLLESAVKRAVVVSDNGKACDQLCDSVFGAVLRDNRTCQRRFWQLFEILQSFQNRDHKLPRLVAALTTDAQRAFASKFEHSEDPGLRTLAKELLLTDAHDPATDPNKQQAFASGLLDPHFRKRVFDTPKLLLEFAPQLRMAFLDGQLTILEGANLLSAVKDVTPKEWSLLREMQRTAIKARDVSSAPALLRARPDSTWDPEDKELFESVKVWMREPGCIKVGPDTGLGLLALMLSRAVSRSEDPSMHAGYGELVEIVGNADPEKGESLLYQYRNYCETLKLPARSFDFEARIPDFEDEDDDDD